ncbi:hypothetical protein FGO68_gene9765 [Halteria grandinella]|uniref:Uncharacterized protein n=1 Tax=Halteria grandinella TaxID=5974 RepID=A0A8J8NR74_HALGN|nr:hypothetical protein FGO68_gene9765 [Halteria grandinella]
MPSIDIFFKDANIANEETSPFALQLYLVSSSKKQMFFADIDEFQNQEALVKNEEVKQNKTASTLPSTMKKQPTIGTICTSPSNYQESSQQETQELLQQNFENDGLLQIAHNQCDIEMEDSELENYDESGQAAEVSPTKITYIFFGQNIKLPNGQEESTLEFTLYKEGFYTQISERIFYSIDEIKDLYTDQIISSYVRSLNHIIFKKFKSYSALKTFKRQFPQLSADPLIELELNYIQSIFNPVGGFTEENDYIKKVMNNFTKRELIRFMRNNQTRTIYLQFSHYLLLMPFNLTYKKDKRKFTEKDFKSQVIKFHDLARLYELADKFATYD